MNYLEAQIENLNRRIKNIEENPDPKQLKVNKLLYEIQRDGLQRQLTAVKKGRLFAYTHHVEEILEPMGFTCLHLTTAADRPGKKAAEYFRLVRSAGYPSTICDRFQMALAMILSRDLPRPDLVASVQACDVETLINMSAAHLWNVPYYFVDFRYRTSIPVEYAVEQFREMIEFVERRFPEAKFDEEKLEERIRRRKLGMEYLHEVGQLLKTVPSPITGRDAFRIVSPGIAESDPRGLEYLQTLRDEIRERVQKGISPCPNENMRILWAVTGPYFGGLFKVLEKYEASMPVFLWSNVPEAYGLTPKYFYDVSTNIGRNATPLEEATAFLLTTWTGPADLWVREIVHHCKELKIDGVVYYQLSGCPSCRPVARMVSDTLEKELGIPTLPLEGWMVDQEKYDASGSEEKLEEFLALCYRRKEDRE